MKTTRKILEIFRKNFSLNLFLWHVSPHVFGGDVKYFERWKDPLASRKKNPIAGPLATSVPPVVHLWITVWPSGMILYSISVSEDRTLRDSFETLVTTCENTQFSQDYALKSYPYDLEHSSNTKSINKYKLPIQCGFVTTDTQALGTKKHWRFRLL
jgi:hypothetical protein